ncbi:3-hydroxyisobutyryl-CoA hydrolase [uncultured Corynebacterium sp.]|uniref:3-hydroxyisobutyryl-CoA hydrolase n=1 Tax=uncultured Corynebacterium sp. TaxID=159447 RepID=UPI0025D4B716|nr:3-hydroxyisobutyryl-CoA hydrolase [uncultured Corynebacterium sp.]
MTDTAPIVSSIRNHTGVIELNRPKALNSLTPEMIHLIAESLAQWRDNDEVEQVLFLSTSPKAYCAGGDVRYAREGVQEGKLGDVDKFFAEEYTLNGDIAEYPKPVIALIDGIAMGGGLGISAHGTHRVVTDKTFASMPEMNIGYVTDVGMAYAAQRAVGTRGKASPELAKFWGITGYRMYAADLVWSGLATHYVANGEAFASTVIEEGLAAALSQHATAPSGEAPLAACIDAIEDAFSHDTWQDITAALDSYPELKQQVEKLTAQACPTSIVAAMELFRAEQECSSVREALEMETNLGAFMYRRADFAEGVRAVLVDKTNDAAFEPAALDDVDVDAIRSALHVHPAK